MADLSYSKFLYDYFKQLHMNHMPEGQKARVKKLYGKQIDVPNDSKDGFAETFPNDNRPGWMKDWRINGIGPKSKEVVDLPKPPTDKKELEALYSQIMNTFRNLNSQIPGLESSIDGPGKYSKLAEWIAPYFGDGKPFGEFQPSGELQGQIGSLVDFLSDENNPNNIPIIEHIKNKILRDGYSLGDFISNFRAKNFNDQFFQKFNEIIQGLIYSSDTAPYLYYDANGKVKKEISYFMPPDGKFFKIISRFEKEKDTVDGPGFAQFMQPPVFVKLFNDLYSNKDFREIFGNSGGRNITAPINKALNDNDYSKVGWNLKGNDKLTWLQQAKKNVNDVIDGTIGKLTDRHKRHNYTMSAAKEIVGVIKDLGISPTDGLDKLVQSDQAVKGRLADQNAGKIWDLFTSLMKEVKDSGMKNAYAGALKNGMQMNAIIKHVIRRTVMESDPPKFDEAKAILEMLSVLRYGNLSSEKWGEWKKNPLDLWKGVKGMDSGFLKWFAVGSNWAVNRGVDALFWAGQMGVNVFGRRKTQFGKQKGEDRKKFLDEFGRDDPDGMLKSYQERYKTAAKDRHENHSEISKDIYDETGIAKKDAAKKERSMKRFRGKIGKKSTLQKNIARDEKNVADKEREFDELNEKLAKYQEDLQYAADPTDAERIRHGIDYTQDEIAKARREFEVASEILRQRQSEFALATEKAEQAEETFNAARNIAGSSHELVKDLEKRREAEKDPVALAELDRKISSFGKKHAFEAARKNLDAKKKDEVKRKKGLVKKGQAYSVDRAPEEKSKHEQAAELMAFWDYLTTGHAEDWKLFAMHSKFNDKPGEQEKFTENNAKNNPFAAYAADWIGQNAA